MVEVNSETDLFGDRLQMPRERRGRPAHERTRETSNRVLLLFAGGAKPIDAAKALGITLPTFHKHYFYEVEQRASASWRVKGLQLSRLNDQAEKGNVAAEKELMRALDRERLQQLADQVADQGPRPSKAKAPKLGKKEEQKLAAQGVGGIFAPPPAPQLIN